MSNLTGFITQNNIKFIEDVPDEMFQYFIDKRLYYPGRLFVEVYKNPRDHSDKIDVAIYEDNNEPIAISMFTKGYDYGYYGGYRDGSIGCYVKPEYRRNGIASALVRTMADKTKYIMGHTDDLLPTIRSVNIPNRFILLH